KRREDPSQQPRANGQSLDPGPGRPAALCRGSHAGGRDRYARCIGWCPLLLNHIAILVVALLLTPLPARTDRSVYDQAGVIDAGDEQRLEALHRELWQKAGVAIVVLTVPQLEDETIADLAVRAGQQWGV